MSKSFYIFIALLLGVSLWELVPIAGIFNSSTVPVMMALWMVVGVVYYRKLPEAYDAFNFGSYKKYYYWLYAGIILSIVPAYFFWKHDFLMSLLVNRGLIVYLFIPVFFASSLPIRKSCGALFILPSSTWWFGAFRPF